MNAGNLMNSCRSLVWWFVVDLRKAMVSLRMVVAHVSNMVECRNHKKDLL